MESSMIYAVAQSAPPIECVLTRDWASAGAAAATSPANGILPQFWDPGFQATEPGPETRGNFALPAALLDRLAEAGVLPPLKVSSAMLALSLLALWGAPAPTDLSDGSDGDFSLIWRDAPVSASLSFTADEILGYAFSPDMRKPWLFEGQTIGAVALNAFFRTLR